MLAASSTVIRTRAYTMGKANSDGGPEEKSVLCRASPVCEHRQVRPGPSVRGMPAAAAPTNAIFGALAVNLIRVVHAKCQRIAKRK